MFLLPGLVLHYVVAYRALAKALEVAARIGVYVLLAFGLPFLFMGFSHLTWKPVVRETRGGDEPDASQEVELQNEGASEEKGRKTEIVKTVVAVVILVLNLATAAMKLAAAQAP